MVLERDIENKMIKRSWFKSFLLTFIYKKKNSHASIQKKGRRRPFRFEKPRRKKIKDEKVHNIFLFLISKRRRILFYFLSIKAQNLLTKDQGQENHFLQRCRTERT